VFVDWAANGETAEGLTVLDAIREAFDEAVPAFSKLGRSLEALTSKVHELEQELEALRATSLNAEESSKEIQSTLKGRVSHLESELAQRRAEMEETDGLLKTAQQELGILNEKLERLRNSSRKEAEELRRANAEAEEQLRERYGEIVTLTRMLSTETMAARKFERNAARLGSIAQEFERGLGRGRLGRWLNSMLPWRWQFKRIRRRIERQGLFDSRAYLKANPDVASAGVNPLRHYLAHGASEGRPLGIE
jgi:chromosome segregation ATPase